MFQNLLNCNTCKTTVVCFFSKLDWAGECQNCKGMVLAPLVEGQRYVMSHCATKRTIFRLDYKSKWFSCKCCIYEFLIDFNSVHQFGNEAIFNSIRTVDLVDKVQKEVEELRGKLHTLQSVTGGIVELEEEFESLSVDIKDFNGKRLELQRKIEKEEERIAIENKTLKEELAEAIMEIGESKQTEFEEKIFEQLKIDLNCLQSEFKEISQLNHARSYQIETFQKKIPDLNKKNNERMEEINELLLKLKDSFQKLKKFPPEYAQVLLHGDISKVKKVYQKEISELETKNNEKGEWLNIYQEGIRTIGEKFQTLKDDYSKKWKVIFDSVKNEEQELTAAEDRRRETMQRRLEFVLID